MDSIPGVKVIKAKKATPKRQTPESRTPKEPKSYKLVRSSHKVTRTPKTVPKRIVPHPPDTWDIDAVKKCVKLLKSRPHVETAKMAHLRRAIQVSRQHRAMLVQQASVPRQREPRKPAIAFDPAVCSELVDAHRASAGRQTDTDSQYNEILAEWAPTKVTVGSKDSASKTNAGLDGARLKKLFIGIGS
ncbi:Protein kinase domain [Carpediemonas membranifera]|uniref:Protein kinase domain n=1 Tax=Carpediemonas membranifera TaxID=201153 RepID=A0A8J6AXB4_9EUKA|nr:Protein kinase domain [Carpediemonas membranifera]|eukprot:KAG9393840.1 Protein kinase domain [Carpediemonas membranifera]